MPVPVNFIDDPEKQLEHQTLLELQGVTLPGSGNVRGGVFDRISSPAHFTASARRQLEEKRKARLSVFRGGGDDDDRFEP